MEKAIKKAIEGGYRKNDSMVIDGSYFNMIGDRIFLDLEFWQSLGNSLGWNSFSYKKRIGTSSTSFKTKTIKITRKSGVKRNWVYHWHRFIDHLAEGGTPDEFFDKLLSH